ncbi:fungal Zn2-Cys6 binuclear cluster domain-containing protein [Heterostelium album PN500]|uniref:Fungal Zn2-Cys6 binuclear cluster domain-containing protein n=1 Tax=Heterostelium pallidum (strain ATCC 26659 / Pp 5 / PN500) TaxID=670386 RepID=D3B6P9_HETP5|nr:fungal Zn2-Cys6 binuclear cluster domain-containing protein [Heterostelium album PN500]EFA83019.1 fungal Zn2-Cys6 binuclear cluster domain-containing protein [Heterostelium album PN500]|eukprot:XP_020435136.1 fungal Zn2-Cys6 binuclear cluster domain-containing protein [Heterostelium album PN500]
MIKRVRRACLNCRNSKVACDQQRPCTRCVKQEIGHTCYDLPRKKREKKIKQPPNGASAIIANNSPGASPSDSANGGSFISIKSYSGNTPISSPNIGGMSLNSSNNYPIYHPPTQASISPPKILISSQVPNNNFSSSPHSDISTPPNHGFRLYNSSNKQYTEEATNMVPCSQPIDFLNSSTNSTQQQNYSNTNSNNINNNNNNSKQSYHYSSIFPYNENTSSPSSSSSSSNCNMYIVPCINNSSKTNSNNNNNNKSSQLYSSSPPLQQASIPLNMVNQENSPSAFLKKNNTIGCPKLEDKIHYSANQQQQQQQQQQLYLYQQDQLSSPAHSNTNSPKQLSPTLTNPLKRSFSGIQNNLLNIKRKNMSNSEPNIHYSKTSFYGQNSMVNGGSNSTPGSGSSSMYSSYDSLEKRVNCEDHQQSSSTNHSPKDTNRLNFNNSNSNSNSSSSTGSPSSNTGFIKNFEDYQVVPVLTSNLAPSDPNFPFYSSYLQKNGSNTNNNNTHGNMSGSTVVVTHNGVQYCVDSNSYELQQSQQLQHQQQHQQHSQQQQNYFKYQQHQQQNSYITSGQPQQQQISYSTPQVEDYLLQQSQQHNLFVPSTINIVQSQSLDQQQSSFTSQTTQLPYYIGQSLNNSNEYTYI